jgi:hypothetical protein
MTRVSSFQGLEATKIAGENYIREKQIYLMYLAHNYRLLSQTFKPKFIEFDSIINSI